MCRFLPEHVSVLQNMCRLLTAHVKVIAGTCVCYYWYICRLLSEHSYVAYSASYSNYRTTAFRVFACSFHECVHLTQ